MKTKYYFDEAGYTGADLTNEEQPVFCVGSVRFTDDEIQQIKNDLSLNENVELHFKKLYKTQNGRQLLLAILSHPLVNRDTIKIGIAEKRYCVYAQMVDVLVETLANKIGENLYANRGALIMANLLYSFALHHPDQTRVRAFEKAFVTMIREQNLASIEEFYKQAEDLYKSPETNKEFREMLDFVLASRITVVESFTQDKFYLDNTLTVFIGLVHAWYKQTKIRMNIKFDQSKPIAERKELIEELMKKRKDSIKIGPKGMEHQYPLPIDNFELVDSKEYIGIQIADIIASSANFILTNEKPQYAEFKEKLKAIPVMQIADVTLTPASAAFLQEAIETPYDESPIDDLVSFIEDDKKQ